MGIAALVLGIISATIAVIFGSFGWLAAIIGIIGIVLGALARKNGGGGAATAGLVLSIVGTVLGLVVYIACAACIASAGSIF